MTDNTNNKSSIWSWLIAAAAIGGLIVYFYLKNKNPTMTLQPSTLQSLNSQPIINLNLEGLERRFENLEYRMEQLHIQRYSPNTYLTMSPIPAQPIVTAKLEKEEVKMDKDDSGKGEESIDKGDIYFGRKFEDYWDTHHTTTNAVATDPVNPDSPLYDVHNIRNALGRKPEIIYISNDSTEQVTGTLYVIVSHTGYLAESKEELIYAGEMKRYFNVYFIKVRSPTQGLAYRVSEYEIKKI